jgi:hypothetical protein
MKLPELVVLDHLQQKLSVPVKMEHTEDDPESYVILERVGSGRTDRIYRVSFALQSYAESMYKAALLNEEVKSLMDEIIEKPEVSKVTLDSDYNDSDTATKEYRYQCVYDLVFFS